MLNARVTRLEFLRLVAFFVIFLVSGLGKILFSIGRSPSPLLFYNFANAQTSGSWQLGPSTSAIPINASLLYTGDIFYLAGSGYNLINQFGPFIAKVYNPYSGAENSVSLSEDLFCAGNTQLANGNILLAGGTQLYDISPNSCNGYWHGLNVAYEFDVQSGSLNKVSFMKQGRWYPTCVLLPDGKVFVTGGMDDYGTENRLVEVYNPGSKSWNLVFDSSRNLTYCVGSEFTSTCPGAGSPCYGGSGNAVSPWVSLYPRMHLMPSGNLVTAGQVPTIRTWNPANGQWKDVGAMSMYRTYGTSILLPLQNISSERGKVLIVGGSINGTAPATTTVEMVDFNQGSSTNPVIRSVSSVQYGRRFLLPVILPNGKIVIFGGSSQANEFPVYVPEMFDPQTESWSTLPSASVPRVYHSVALLLPDGSVWTGGSSLTRSTWESRTEIFKPSYFFSGNRPAINGNPSVGDYANSITIQTPDAANISICSLVKLPCATHHYDTDSRLLWLQVTNRTSNSITVSAPLNANLAPPGYYMIHVLDGSNIPSFGKIIKIPGSGTGVVDTTPPAQVTGLALTTVSSTQLNLTWTANTEPDLNHYNIYQGTTAGFTVTPGTTPPTGTPNTNSFSSTGLSPSTTYYYRVAAVDNAGNIGTLSSEISGTTSNPAFYNVPGPADSYAILRGSPGDTIRYGEEPANTNSLLIGKRIKTLKVRLRKRGSPSGAINARIRRKSDDVIMVTFNESVQAQNLGTSFSDYIFTLGAQYTLSISDRILIEYSGPNGVDIEVWTTDHFDGVNTRRVRYTTQYIYEPTQDIVGTMSSE